METIQILKEGEAINKWIGNRFKRNKNVLIAFTGATGSGKSWTALKICELWYEYQFENKKFPVETHVCFSITKLMKLLTSGKLRKGELIILEEAGTSLNSLDFQNKVSKLFSFILQSFRSMNVGLIFTLPVLTMLNKSARLLLHAHFITQKIDHYLETCTIKPLFHQLNQERGKSYWKYLRMIVGNRNLKIERFTFSKPSPEFISIYEAEKKKFVYELSNSFSKHLDEIDKDNERKMSRDSLSPLQLEVFEDVIELGMTPIESSKKRGRSKKATYELLQRIKEKGFSIEKWVRYRNLRPKKPQIPPNPSKIPQITKENEGIEVQTDTENPLTNS